MSDWARNLLHEIASIGDPEKCAAILDAAIDAALDDAEKRGREQAYEAVADAGGDNEDYHCAAIRALDGEGEGE